MKNVVIFGAGGHAHVIADIIRSTGNAVIAFLDDNLEQPDCSGPISDYSKYKECEFVIGIGSNDVRKKISSLPLKWHTAIHPSAIVSQSATVDEGTVIMPNVVLNARSRVGRHCIINTGSIVEHDNEVDDFCHVSVGVKLGGTVKIGSNCLIGIGSTIKNNVNVCSDAVIGAGSLVLHDITEKGTYFGVPVKKQQ